MTLNKVIELRKVIKTTIQKVHPRVFYEGAPENVLPPYIVFNLPSSISNSVLENFVLEIDGWDSPADGDTTELETMMDAVDKALQRKTFVVPPNLFFTLYRDGRETLTEKDSRIKHRRYTYQVRTYGE